MQKLTTPQKLLDVLINDDFFKLSGKINKENTAPNIDFCETMLNMLIEDLSEPDSIILNDDDFNTFLISKCKIHTCRFFLMYGEYSDRVVDVFGSIEILEQILVNQLVIISDIIKKNK